MQTTASHINQQRTKADWLKAQVCKLLYWNDQQYCNLQFETGFAYLEHYIPQDRWGQDILSKTHLFWAWWKNHWTRRDDLFVHEVKDSGLSVENLRKLYLHWNDAKILAQDIYPNSIVLGDDFARMIGEVITKEVEK